MVRKYKMIKKLDFSISREDLSIKTVKLGSLPIDVMDLLSINKRKAYRLIDTFLEVNEYQNIKREKAIVDLIEVLFNVLLEYPDSIFTEDNLIDLGNLLMRLNYQRVNMYDDNYFENIINMGYELIDSLNMKIKHK